MQSVQRLSRRKWLLGLSALTGLLISPPASAQFSLSSDAIVGLGKVGGFIYSLDDKHASGATVSASATHSFTGLDSAGHSQTMDFSGNTVATAEYGRLHSFTTGAVFNSYYNAANTDYANHDAQLNDPNGSPGYLCSLGFAVFDDTLQYGGALQSGYRARYIFHVDGTNSGTGTLADLSVQIAMDTPESFFAGDPGFFAADWVTQDHPVNGVTPQQIHVQFSNQVVFDVNLLAQGQDYSGTSDFSSTLTLTGIELVDANGNLASGWTVTSASGTQYRAIQGVAVPEPGTFALLLVSGVAGAGLLRRRRK